MITPDVLKAYKLLHNGVVALASLEHEGLCIDTVYCEEQKAKLTQTIENLEKGLQKTDFYNKWKNSLSTGKSLNTNSGTQLAEYLYKVKGLRSTKFTPTGKGSTDEESLAKLNIPELNTILRIRKLKKIRDTYITNLLKEQTAGKVHPFFNLHTVKTFRSSSDRPNFQNIPKRDVEAFSIVRQAVIPRPGHQFLEIDFSSLEVRIAACYHKDPTMLRYIRTPNSDLHADMAKEIFMLDEYDNTKADHRIFRQATKNGFVFPQFYGDYYKNCALNIAANWLKLSQGTWYPKQGVKLDNFEHSHISNYFISRKISSLQKFTEHLQIIETKFWNKRFPVYQAWKEKWYREYLKKGYVPMYTGFLCQGTMSKNDVINYPVQGAAFHCLLWVVIQVVNYLKKTRKKSKAVCQIHDSLLLDIHPEELTEIVAYVKKICTQELNKHWEWIVVPLDIEMEIAQVGESWAQLRPYNP